VISDHKFNFIYIPEEMLLLPYGFVYLTFVGRLTNRLPSEKMEGAAEAFKTKLSILSTEQEESMLRDAGFENVSSFYSAFTFRGWVAYAPL
jgi:hypothetical protein